MPTTIRPLAAWCAASALSVTACDHPFHPDVSRGDATTAPAMARADGDITKPFTASLFTALALLAPDESCGAPPRLMNVQEGWGEATHLGRFSVRITFCVDLSDILDDGQLTEGESLPYDNGVGTLTAANGDVLHMTIAGAVVPSDHPDFDFEFQDPFQFVGGTGRFDGATGGGVTNSLVDFGAEPTRTTHKWSGTLVLPGRE